MSNFIQIHMLTSYPPSNLNRDDTGRPKSAMVGGVPRLRISSQSLKRAWRTSDEFQTSLSGNLGVRTKEMGRKVYHELVEQGTKHKDAVKWSQAIAGQFGKLKTLSKKDKDGLKKLDEQERLGKELEEVEIEQLAHFGVEEQQAISDLIALMAKRGEGPTADELKLLRRENSAADIALFGRMLAAAPSYNLEAAAQVAHAFTVHRVDVESDYFTAVDDLNQGVEDVGAGHIGETEFGSGLFYKYICINKDLLVDNLSGDTDLAANVLTSFLEAAATVAPTGKQNSFGSRARASFIRCEKGSQQPRSLAVAFLTPVRGEGYLEEAIANLQESAKSMNKLYGDNYDDCQELNGLTQKGNLDELKSFITE